MAEVETTTDYWWIEEVAPDNSSKHLHEPGQHRFSQHAVEEMAELLASRPGKRDYKFIIHCPDGSDYEWPAP